MYKCVCYNFADIRTATKFQLSCTQMAASQTALVGIPPLHLPQKSQFVFFFLLHFFLAPSSSTLYACSSSLFADTLDDSVSGDRLSVFNCGTELHYDALHYIRLLRVIYDEGET